MRPEPQSRIGNLAARDAAGEMLVELGDVLDAEKAMIATRVAPVEHVADMMLESGARNVAATLLDWIAVEYRKATFIGTADRYERRAKDCRRRRRTGK